MNNIFTYDNEFSKYYIACKATETDNDNIVAKYLGLDIKQYNELLIKFGAKDIYKAANVNIHNRSESYYFKNLQDCIDMVNYLNENLDKFLVAKELTK